MTFLKVQKVAPPPASVLLVGTMLLKVLLVGTMLLELLLSTLLLLEKVASVHLASCCGGTIVSGGSARGWTKTPREGRKM